MQSLFLCFIVLLSNFSIVSAGFIDVHRQNFIFQVIVFFILSLSKINLRPSSTKTLNFKDIRPRSLEYTLFHHIVNALSSS